MAGDAYDYAPPEVVRWTETFWSLHGSTFDRDQAGVEIGCGRGESVLRLAPFIGRMTGLERDPDDAAIAARRCEGRPGVSAQAWNGRVLPFPDGALDLAFADLTRPGLFLEDRATTWADARRVLKPDARLLLLAFRDVDEARALRDAWTDRLFEVGFALDALPPLLDPEALAAELRRAGFDPRVQGLGPALLEVDAAPTSPEG